MSLETEYTLKGSGRTKYPVTFVQFCRQKQAESRMLYYVLTALGIIVFVPVAVFHVFFYYNWSWLCRRSDRKKIDMIPGPKPFPFFGNMLELILPPEGK